MDRLLSDSLSALDVKDLSRCDDDWQRLSGGRTNALWTYKGPGGRLVCKCFCGQGTALFDNDAHREAQALRHLEGTGLAPRLIATANALPPSLLYAFVEGATWAGDLEKAAGGLRRVHGTLPPNIPKVDHSPSALLASAAAMHANLSTPPQHSPPTLSDVAPYEPAFLHGDPVPSNMIDTADGLMFIDWQCPCIGDPVTDLAVFLSPAMQTLYGGRDLTAEDHEAFLDAYNSKDIAQRYLILAPLLHWRIALHCLLRAESGASDYANAAALEFAFLKRLT